MSKQVLITGATGFVGQVLREHISKKNFEIKVVTRQPQKLSCPTINVGQINGLTDWKPALEGVEVVIHLAAYAHVTQRSQINTDTNYETNVLGTENLVKHCISANVKQFIFISSIGAVASFSNKPITEESPCIPDTIYGKSKLEAEKDLIYLTKNTDLTYTIIRPPLVYGRGNPGNMARLQKLIRRNISLPFAKIANQRSFIYVDNLVDAIITCIHHPKAHNQTFLVSDGQDLSTPELISKIAYHSQQSCHQLAVPIPFLKAAGYFGDLWEAITRRPIPLNSDTIAKLISSLTIDSSKIRQVLDWHPPYTIDQGLSKVFQQE